MDILLWLAAPLAVTALAMAWVLWTGRTRHADAPTEAAYVRFSAAVTRPMPVHSRHAVSTRPERPSGVAVRPSQRRPSAGA